MNEQAPFVITISRMLGSGGAYVGQQLAKKLDILYMDREIIQKAAKELHVSEEALASHEERLSSIWESMFQASSIISDSVYIVPEFIIPDDHALFDTEALVIEETAKTHSAVVLGRCGAHVLKDHPRHLSVFLHADLDFRKGRVMELYGLSEKEAVKRIHDSDKGRNSYCRMFAGKDFTDATQYALCLDAGRLGVDECVEAILKLAESRFGAVRASE